jgi:hypothetical protein
VLISQEKWDRLKRICRRWKDHLRTGETRLPHSELRADRGFMVHATHAYPAMKPYLKGFHLALETWRGGRDADGWKIRNKQEENQANTDEESSDDVEDMLLEDMIDGEETLPPAHQPESGYTFTVPRFEDDLDALLRLTASIEPTRRIVRSSKVITAFYGFGDASSGGFGSTIALGNGTQGRYGLWASDVDDESSNYRELRNLVEAVEAEAAEGLLNDAELWLFTDNSTAESCWVNGSSSSRLLHELTVRLKIVEMTIGFSLHVVHVAGTRMIEQGTDGLSRGILTEGVLAGKDMLDYIDIAKSAPERHPPILDFVQSLLDDSMIHLTAQDWFFKGHGITGGYRDLRGVWIPHHAPNGRCYLWTPPPVIADVALEEAMKAIHKRTDATHVFIIPRLCTPIWRRWFFKMADFHCIIPAGSKCWPSSLHEPLFLGISFPLIRYSPWTIRGTPLLVELGRKLQEVLRSGEGDGRNILCELLRIPRRVCSVSERVARGVLRMSGDRHIPDAHTRRC